MSGRDRTQEILDVKQRDARWTWFGPHAIESLQRDWQKNRDKPGATPDFYVIRAVTLMEVFTRRNLADTIDHDRTFTDRAIEFSKHVKIDFALVKDIQGKTITLGDILAHSVPVNSFGQVVGYFETLLGKPLRPLLEAIVDRWDTEIMKKPRALIVDDYDGMARSLSRLFEVRHILCHEAPRKSAYEVSEIDGFLDKAIRLVKALHEILTLERFGLVPLTQTAMNIAAAEELTKTEAEMNKLLISIETRLKEVDSKPISIPGYESDASWLEHLKNVQEKWLAYRKAHCDFETYLNRGGTIRSLLWGKEAMRLTERRIADLESWLTRDADR
jgi:uncharacterized protein YecT (DUF1311 family)